MTTLDIYSDPICPWCYIGKTYLDRAIEELRYNPFRVEWHPFQLNPNMPMNGIDRQKYLEEKFGGKKGALSAYGPILDHAKKLGLELALDKIQKTPNTFNAHRLIHWAGLGGCQTAVASALFEAYFLDGCDLGNVEVLLKIAKTFSLDSGVVQKLFYSNSDTNEIDDKETKAKIRGIHSVPVFFVANAYVVSGAQTTGFWKYLISEIRRSKL